MKLHSQVNYNNKTDSTSKNSTYLNNSFRYLPPTRGCPSREGEIRGKAGAKIDKTIERSIRSKIRKALV